MKVAARFIALMPFVGCADPEHDDQIGCDKSRGHLDPWDDVITDSDWQTA
jgi:hypothetical protein